ncbi:MAG: YlcI/YnfO family protein [Egibacteraceae bacterium]
MSAVSKKKIAVSVDPDVLAAISEEVKAEGTSISGFVNAACASEIRSRRLLRAIRQWEAEHGEITDEELQRAWTELLG